MCGERLRSSAVDIDRPVLVASMIVKDEEKMIGDCLESLTGLVDRVEVVDTGSSDETVRIARDHGAKVTEVEWRDDFAWARNQAADLCRDALYTLWIDADERVVADDPSLVRDLLAINAGDVEAFDINLSNLSDGPGSEASSTVRLRRIVSSELLSFTGRLHEVTTRLGAPDEPFEATTLDAISLNHLGYVAEVIAAKGKRERNIQLARAQYASDDSVKASVDLARMLMVGDQSDEAVALLRDAVDSVGVTRADWGAYLHGSLAHVLMNTGQVEEAATIARQAFEMLPTDDLAGAVFATTSIILGREAEFLKLLLETDTHGLREPVFRSPKNVRIIEEAVVVAKARLGNLQETWDEVQSWFEDGRDFSEGTWEAVAEVACRRAAGTELLDLTIGFAERKPETTGFMRAVSRLVAPEMTAILALGVLTAGEPAIDAVSTGLVSAIVLGRWDLFDDLVQFAEQLDSSVRTHLADKVEAMGQHQRAQQLRCAGQRQKTAAGHPGGHGG
ncbi:MAG: glycosyltransferase [Actinomycetia bacterium]|nr:glycosyltransferase [Actinomycetes bacterium]